jgi:hypothetical protein
VLIVNYTFGTGTLNTTIPGHYRLELDVWGRAHKNSEDFLTPRTEDTIMLEGQGNNGVSSVTASVDGRVVLQYEGPFTSVDVSTIFWARNSIGFPDVALACGRCTVSQLRINHMPVE